MVASTGPAVIAETQEYDSFEFVQSSICSFNDRHTSFMYFRDSAWPYLILSYLHYMQGTA